MLCALVEKKLRILVALLTGFIALNRHLSVMKVRTDPLCSVAYFAQFSLGPPLFYTHAKFQVSSFSRSGDRRASRNLKSRYPLSVEDQDPRLTQCSMGPQECAPQTAS